MRWTLKPLPTLDKVSNLAKKLSIDTNLATLLVQRNIDFRGSQIIF